jgi:two-component system, NtrC family, nitrogen regulation sensor histidine kinase NtrY
MAIGASIARLVPGRRWIAAYIVILVMLGLASTGRWFFLRSIHASWPVLQREVDSTLAADIARRFTDLSTQVEEESREIRSLMGTALPALRETSARARLIESLIERYRSTKISIEVRDHAGGLVAYAGRAVDAAVPAPAAQADTMFAHRAGPTVYLVSRAILRGGAGKIVGFVDAALPLESTLPISNRFTAAGSFRERTERDLGIDLLLRFGRDSDLASDGRYVRIPLIAGGGKVSVAFVLHTDPAAYQETVGRQFDQVIAFLALAFAFVMLLHGFRVLRLRGFTPVSVLFFILFLLFLRACMAFFDVDTALLPSPLLDPRYYASSFGAGLARSIGALTISLGALAVATTLLARIRFDPGPRPSRMLTVVTLVLLGLTPFCLRGYFAALRGFVFDSSFAFDDIQSIFAAPMLWLMLANVLLLAFSLVAFLGLLFRMARTSLMRESRLRHPLSAAAGASSAGLVTLFLTASDPLVPAIWYLALQAAFLVVVYRMPQRIAEDSTRLTVALFACLWMTATVSTAVLMPRDAHDKRRMEIEAMAEETILPNDIRSRVLVEDALVQLRSHAMLENVMPTRSDGADVELAFALWSASALTGQSENSALVVSDADGRLVSRFSVGIRPELMRGAFLEQCLAIPDDSVTAIRIASGGDGPLWYAGSSVVPMEGRPLRLTVIMSARDRTLPSRAAVDLLRNTPSRESLAPEDRFALCRFVAGRMTSASDPTIVKATPLPSGVATTLRHAHAVWDKLDDRDAYFIRAEEDGSIACIAAGAPDSLFTLYRGVRSALFFLIPVLLALGIAQKRRIRSLCVGTLSLTTILQLSFIAVAAIPLTLIWAGARTVMAENTRHQIERQLGESLRTLHAGIDTQSAGTDVHAGIAAIDDDACFRIASLTGKELNVYEGATLRASNRPELYSTGLLNSRCDPEAFLRLIVLRQDFASTEERIGDFSYRVGYAAIRDAAGSPLALISTPTLYDRWQIEEESIRATAVISLGAALVIVLVLAFSRVVAALIARPIRAFTAATRDIAAGNFERRVEARGPLELELLRHSFNLMTEQVQASRRDLAAAERELAWREMARQVAHEIRNPLTPIKLAAQHLRRAWDDRAEDFGVVLRKVTDTIIEQIGTLSRISDEFSSFARMPRRTLTEVSVGDTLAEAAQLFQHHGHVTMRVVIPDALPPVRADRDELLRAFINILKNAVQSIHDRGEIAVSVTRDARRIRIAFEDSGSGIAPELLPRVFEPNFSTRTEGMGLGLAITKKIIDDLDGKISIESTEGKGTIVRVELIAE